MALSGDKTPGMMREELENYFSNSQWDVMRDYLTGTLQWCREKIDATRN